MVDIVDITKLRRRNIMPQAAIQGVADTDVFRLFDPTTRIFYFRGTTYDVQAIADAVMAIGNSAVARRQALEAVRNG